MLKTRERKTAMVALLGAAVSILALSGLCRCYVVGGHAKHQPTAVPNAWHNNIDSIGKNGHGEGIKETLLPGQTSWAYPALVAFVISMAVAVAPPAMAHNLSDVSHQEAVDASQQSAEWLTFSALKLAGDDVTIVADVDKEWIDSTVGSAGTRTRLRVPTSIKDPTKRLRIPKYPEPSWGEQIGGGMREAGGSLVTAIIETDPAILAGGTVATTGTIGGGVYLFQQQMAAKRLAAGAAAAATGPVDTLGQCLKDMKYHGNDWWLVE